MSFLCGRSRTRTSVNWDRRVRYREGCGSIQSLSTQRRWGKIRCTMEYMGMWKRTKVILLVVLSTLLLCFIMVVGANGILGSSDVVGSLEGSLRRFFHRRSGNLQGYCTRTEEGTSYLHTTAAFLPRLRIGWSRVATPTPSHTPRIASQKPLHNPVPSSRCNRDCDRNRNRTFPCRHNHVVPAPHSRLLSTLLVAPSHSCRTA